MSACAKCGGPLKFVRRGGKRCPVNPDGGDHWDTCRDRRYALAKKGELVKTEDLETWVSGATRFDVRRSTGWITGANYRPVACDCGVPPWERCQHSVYP